MVVLGLSFALFVSACGPSAISGVPASRDSRAWYGDSRLEQLLDRETDSKLVGGNSIDLLVNGKVAFARRYENMESASFVLIKTFIWTDDVEGRKLANAVADRARAGIPVIVQYDVKGNIGSLEDVRDMLSRVSVKRPVGEPQVFADLREAGVTIIATNSPGRPAELKEWVENSKRFFRNPAGAILRSLESLIVFDHVDHDKYFVTGHEGGEIRAILGGLNIASEYALGGIPDVVDPGTGRGGWRDTDIEIQGPAALLVVDEFFADIERHQGHAVPDQMRSPVYERIDNTVHAGDTDLRFITNNPLFGEKKHMDRVFRILIQATPKKEHIFFSTPYFAPSKKLRKAMLDHMRKGGTISVLTNSADSSDITIITDAGRYSARELMKYDRFNLYERKPRPDLGERMLHQKVASFGTHGPMVIGSANLDAQSFVHNGEAVVVVQDAELRRAFDAMVAVDLDPKSARRVPRDDLNHPSVLDRIKQFSAGKLAWYWL